MKRILYIDEPLNPPGGGQISLFTVLKNLDRKEYEFKVFLKNDGVFRNMLSGIGVKADIVKISSLFIKIKEYDPDIVHINSACTRYSFFSAFWSKFLRKKTVWHNRVLDSSPTKERIISLFSDRIIAVSQAVKNKFGYADKKTVIMHNPIDFNDIRSKSDGSLLKQKIGIREGFKVIGVFSRLEKWKGHDSLFKAFAELKNTQTALLVCGFGAEMDNLKKLSSDLNISERVFFAGHVNNVYDYMDISDIVVNPSAEPEPFGRTIIEAMALGKPVIATDMGGAKEIINNAEDGFLVEPNEKDLKNAIEKFLEEKDLYLKISKQALAKAKGFDINPYMNNLYKIYRELL